MLPRDLSRTYCITSVSGIDPDGGSGYHEGGTSTISIARTGMRVACVTSSVLTDPTTSHVTTTSKKDGEKTVSDGNFIVASGTTGRTVGESTVDEDRLRLRTASRVVRYVFPASAT